MYRFLYAVARFFWPDLAEMNPQRQMIGVGDVVTTLISAPLALVGLVWLVIRSQDHIALVEWWLLLLFILLFVIFSRLEYFIIIEIRSDRYGSSNGSLASMIQWTAVFLLGPATLWISVLWGLANYFWNWQRGRTTAARWNQARNLVQDLATNTLGFLVPLIFYGRWGGVIPIAGLTPEAILPAFAALIVGFFVVFAIWIGYIIYVMWVQRQLASTLGLAPLMNFMALALGLPNLAHPFAIQAAGLYVQNGVLVFLFFLFGLVMVAFLARRLSWAAEISRQRSRQIEQLEHLGREIINSPPDASTLELLLVEHVPPMFPSARIAIFLSPDVLLMKRPDDWEIDLLPVYEWSVGQDHPHAFPTREKLPWSHAGDNHDPVVITPILDVESGQPIGCVYVELRVLAQPWDKSALVSLFPAIKTLADQVASALHQAQIYEETLAYQQAMQELKVAGKIQSSFLPNEIPNLNGWELAVTIIPARETSGDFFDFIPLPDGKIGILIADVADKGVGAALYMALCRTLIRTYALEYVDNRPEVVFFSTNERILKDARANLFVTVFFGILDQETGTLIYSNAGHNPPYLFSRRNGNKVIPLSPTGMPLGVEADEVWQQSMIKLEEDDVLVLYTDGIPDAQNMEGDFFREKRLVEFTRAHLGLTAQEMLVAILGEIEDFVGEAAQFDDITLLVLTRCC